MSEILPRQPGKQRRRGASEAAAGCVAAAGGPVRRDVGAARRSCARTGARMVNGAEGIDAQTFAAAGVKITHRNPVAAGGPATPKWSADGAVGNGARAGTGCHPSLLFPELVPVPETVAA